jgi:crotonobetainyl-CoA:carnitine CoA-transferase CaiB-like acyl-CoA transferase
MEKHEKDEIFRKGQALSCPVAPVYSSKDIVESKQSEARDLFTEMTHPEVGKIKIPTSPYRFSKTPWQLRHPAPLLGQHNEIIYRERLGYTEEELSRLRDDGVI